MFGSFDCQIRNKNYIKLNILSLLGPFSRYCLNRYCFHCINDVKKGILSVQYIRIFFNTWCFLKGHIYLNKPAAESRSLRFNDFLWEYRSKQQYRGVFTTLSIYLTIELFAKTINGFKLLIICVKMLLLRSLTYFWNILIRYKHKASLKFF